MGESLKNRCQRGCYCFSKKKKNTKGAKKNFEFFN
jgi:hypothetical protein